MAAHTISSHGIGRSGERRHGGWPLLEMLKDITGKLAASWAWYRDCRRTEGELARLSDRELDDIGIARCDIPVIAMQSANASQNRC